MLAGKTYCPVLHTRVAEMKGLEKLPEASKDLLFPLFVARPWPNANELNSTWDKISNAFGERRYGLDLDHFARRTASKKNAFKDFVELFDPANGYEKYYAQVSELDFAIPVFQLTDGTIPDIAKQLEHVARINRGSILRLKHSNIFAANVLAAEVIGVSPDTVIFIDLEWTRDLISRELWASGIITAVTALDPELEIVVAGSSFPDSFNAVARDQILAQERAVFEDLVRGHNAVVLTYGDWGSTRAPRDPTPMRTVKRIDVPNSREWVCFRNDGVEDYDDLASRAVRDAAWPRDLNVWGTYLIEGTAESVPGAIRGQAAAAAARINIHLYQQAHFGEPTAFGDSDEPFVD